MMANARISILGNLSKTLIRNKKDIVRNYFSEAKKIQRSSKIYFTEKQLRKYCDLIGWDKKEIPPTFPYTLLTHMQFSMVTDKRFPFSPIGLIHKNERIECLEPLKAGDWHMHSSIPLFRRVEKGYEIEVISVLKIDGKIVWRSTTTAFKQLKRGISGFNFEPINTYGKITWDIPANIGRKYAWISNNFDLIHFSKWTAKLMKLKQPIVHGMFTAAKGMSELQTVKYPLKVDFRFVAPIYMPSKVVFHQTKLGFGVYSENGKRLHLETTLH